jgi:hypothetical protein
MVFGAQFGTQMTAPTAFGTVFLGGGFSPLSCFQCALGEGNFMQGAGLQGWEFRVQSWEVRRGFEDE